MTQSHLVDAPVVRFPAAAPGRGRRFWRSTGWLLVAVIALLAVAMASFLLRPESDRSVLGPGNPQPEGAQALARVLAHQGVRVRTDLNPAEAARAATADSTVVITAEWYIGTDEIEDIVASGADLVLLTPMDPQITAAGLTVGYTPTIELDDSAPPARCADPIAARAESIRPSAELGDDFLFYPTSDLEDGEAACFVAGAGHGSDGAAAMLTRVDGDQRVTAIQPSSILRNDTITEAGNASLALQLLGTKSELLWANRDVPEAEAGSDVFDVSPDWLQPAIVMLIVVAVFAILWRGRRLGRLVTEPLPVVVKGTETAIGRGKLYWRAGARGHASAALRAASAGRLARLVRLPRSAPPESLVEAVSLTTGRPAEYVKALLYGPSPATDEEFVALGEALALLEKEVHLT